MRLLRTLRRVLVLAARDVQAPVICPHSATEFWQTTAAPRRNVRSPLEPASSKRNKVVYKMEKIRTASEKQCVTCGHDAHGTQCMTLEGTETIGPPRGKQKRKKFCSCKTISEGYN